MSELLPISGEFESIEEKKKLSLNVLSLPASTVFIFLLSVVLLV